MFLRGTIRVAAKVRRNAIFAATTVALLSVPAIIYSFGANPPLGNTGAPGEGTCASCHGTLTTPSGSALTVNAPTTYTPGGTAVSMTVSIPGGRGFEATVLTTPGNAQAGTLAAGPAPAGASFPQDGVSTVGTIQYVFSTVETTSWTFSWTPPATNVGNVVLYITGGLNSTSYANTYTMTPAVTPPPLPTLSVSPTSLTFNVNNGTVTPTTGTIMVTSSSSSAPIPYTTSSSTTNCGNWLNVMPPGASTPVSVTVSIPTTVAASLPSGTCTGSVVITPATGSASDGAQTVSVTANVTTPPPPPPPPTLNLNPTGLTFTATVGGTAPSQNVSVTTSDGSAQTFSATATVTTPTGGTWLSIGSTTGTIPASGSATETISVNTTGLAASTTPYTGNVTFNCSTCAPTSITLRVTLTVNSSTPPPPPPTTTSYGFQLVVVDRDFSAGISDWMLLDGSGGVNSTGQLQGSGTFTRFHFPSGGTPSPLRSGREGGSGGTGSGGTGSGGTSNTYVVATGRWRATQVMGFSPIYSPAGCTPGGTTPCRITGGSLNLQVELSTQGCGGTSPSPSCSTAPTTGSMTISSNGSNAGVTLTTSASGWSFVPAGIGTESIGNGDE